jgi:hypothetical protein
MMRRFGLRDDQWERIKDLLPGFLSRGAHGPEHSELLRLIGMLVDSGSTQPSDGTRRYSGQGAVPPASSSNPTTEPFDPVD